MTVEQKAVWVAALRSGEWKQGHGRLHRRQLDATTAHCCLGVADWLFNLGSKSDGYLASEADVRGNFRGGDASIFLSDKDQHVLVHANDSGKTFAQIADIIESDIQPTVS